ncbi:uncharacterized protein [Clytia hemisphaerica]|uniref:Uncharacterized protein n=1 Tax=Clytia hemisphaerica TaxID=252671 RepID=A0A7M5X641_9CNID|eukprot:TCONS_00050451-protein
MGSVIYALVATVLHFICFYVTIISKDKCKSRCFYKCFRVIFIVHLATNGIVFLIIFLFFPSQPPTFYVISLPLMFVLLMVRSLYQYNREKQAQSFVLEEVATFLDENLLKEPKVIVQCEAAEPRTLCCRKQRVIWSNLKEFEFQHWIDVTEQHLVKSQIEEAIFGELKIEFEFDDEETKESYEQHVQNLVKEAKQHSPHAQVNVKQIFQVGEKDIKTYRRSFYGKKALFGEPFVCLQCIFPQIELSFKILKWFLERVGFRSLLIKDVVIKKVISNRNIEAV